MTSRRPLTSTLLAVCTLTFGAGPAGAQSPERPGVFIDPDAPASKEYAIPIDQARSDAIGNPRKRRDAGPTAPPFGEGITARASTSSGSVANAPAPNSGPTGAAGTGTGASSSTGTPAAVPDVVTLTLPTGLREASISNGGSGSALTFAILGLGLLCFAAGVGYAVKRGLGPRRF